LRPTIPHKLVSAIFIALTAACCLSAKDRRIRDKSIYLDLMQSAVEAYTPDRIEDYISEVDSEGIKEHGYARLTSNIGILIAHGRMTQDKELFCRMMDICVRELPLARAKNAHRSDPGNDFAVKEVCCCIMELESAGTFPKEMTDKWRNGLKDMNAQDIYSCKPEAGNMTAHNWCVFGAASECARIWSGMGGDRSFADLYLGDQLRFFDENGMYMDPHQPMVYDFVTRLQYMAALDFGYDGPYREAIEEQLLKSAIPTLEMQSVTGEIPYGGRSNQFLHNETFLAAVCEYYASWMKLRGEEEMAARFKAAALKAAEAISYWTEQKPVRHIKNRYPTETSYGCERYAYFNKYMVTMASWAYLAYRFADDSIKPGRRKAAASTFVTSDKFHRVMMNAGGYTAQWDLNAQREYDASGLGRIQKEGAPPVIAISSPCPTVSRPSYSLDIENDGGLCISPLWDRYDIVEARKKSLILTDGSSIWSNRLSCRGLSMTLKGKGELVMTLPALEYDGESCPEICCDGKSLSVSFNGWTCIYKTKGIIQDSGKIYGSRNGHLRRYEIRDKNIIHVRICIKKSKNCKKTEKI